MAATMVDSNRVRAVWLELLDLVKAGEDVIVVHNGEPVVAMIGYADYSALLDELNDIRSARHAVAILADLEAGRTTTRPLDEIESELKTKGLLNG